MIKILKLSCVAFMGISTATTALAQQSKTEEVKNKANLLKMLGATLEGDKTKQDEVYNRILNENAERDRLKKIQQRTPDQVMNDLWEQTNAQERQSTAYKAHQSEMAAIIAAREARQQQFNNNRAGMATAPSIQNSSAASGAGNGISIEPEITIDDIGIASQRSPRAQTKRTCTCPEGTFEYYGVECWRISDYTPVSSPPGGNYPFHKNCDATYGDPHRISK